MARRTRRGSNDVYQGLGGLKEETYSRDSGNKTHRRHQSSQSGASGSNQYESHSRPNNGTLFRRHSASSVSDRELSDDCAPQQLREMDRALRKWRTKVESEGEEEASTFEKKDGKRLPMRRVASDGQALPVPDEPVLWSMGN